MNPEITIAGRKIGQEHEPFVIAEIGISHGGSMERAEAMIDAAARAGAHAVKFQCHLPWHEMDTYNHPELEPVQHLLATTMFTADQDAALQAYASDCGLTYLSTPFCAEAVERLAWMRLPAWKIGAGENRVRSVLDAICKHTGGPVLLSTGMATLKQIQDSLLFLSDRPVALLHCVSLYPTPYEAVNLPRIAVLREAFPSAVIGVSDHSAGIHTALAAVALGACIIEKHFRLDDQPCPDYEVTVTPAELKQLVDGSRAIWLASRHANTVDEQLAATGWALQRGTSRELLG